MTKQELEKENEELKEELVVTKKGNKTLAIAWKDVTEVNAEIKEENEALKAEITSLKAKTHKDNKVRLDVLISENIEKIEESPVMNSVMRENLESLCRARNLLGGE